MLERDLLQGGVETGFEIVRSPGVVSMGNHYHEGRVFLISNYWGLNEFLKAPLPEGELTVAHIITGVKPYPQENIPRFHAAEKAWLAERKKENRFSVFEYCVSDKSQEEVHRDLEGADVIFMGGGNTQYLHEKIQDSGAGVVIKELVKKGTWYLGKSAGAIVAGPDISPRGFLLSSMATKLITDTRGIGLTDVYPLPHADTPAIMNEVGADGKTGWQIAVEMVQKYPTAFILDNTNKKELAK